MKRRGFLGALLGTATAAAISKKGIDEIVKEPEQKKEIKEHTVFTEPYKETLPPMIPKAEPVSISQDNGMLSQIKRYQKKQLREDELAIIRQLNV